MGVLDSMAAPALKRVKEFLDRPVPGTGSKVFATIFKCVLALGAIVILLAVLVQIVSPQAHWIVYVVRGSPDPPANFTGAWRRWDCEGRLYSEDHYLRGKRDGRSKQWDESGRVDLITSYREGKLHGPFRAYFTNGAVFRTYEHADGKPVGRWVECYPDGTTNWERFYSRPGERDGPELHWKRTGEKEVLRVWRDGTPWDGRFYSMSNQDEILRVYSNGVFVSETNLGPPLPGRPIPSRLPRKADVK